MKILNKKINKMGIKIPENQCFHPLGHQCLKVKAVNLYGQRCPDLINSLTEKHI